MLTKPELCVLCEMLPTTMQNWIDNDILIPAEPGCDGRGNAARFSTMQAVGLVVGHRVYRTERSCSRSYIKMVVKAFERLTDADLLKKLKKGATHLLLVVHTEGGPVAILDGADKYGERINVKEAYEQVLAAEGREPRV